MKMVVLRGGRMAAPAPLPPGAWRQGAGHDPAPTGQHGALAFTAQGGHWTLLNIAPNVAAQLQDDEALPCHAGLRHARSRSVVLTDAQVDHVSGLLSLRHGAPIELYATPAVFEVLSQSMPVLQVLQHYCGLHWHVIPVAGETLQADFRIEQQPTLEFTALATDGLVPPYLPEHESANTIGLSIALAVRDTVTGQRVFFAPGAVQLGATERDWLRGADCVLLDDHAGWTGDEAFEEWRAQRRIAFGPHQPPSPTGAPAPSPAHGKGHAAPAARAGTAGFEAAFDGMVIEL